MGKDDWVSCKIPVKMAEAIDEFLDSDAAKMNGVFSRTEFLTALVRAWFASKKGESNKEFRLFMAETLIGNEEMLSPFYRLTEEGKRVYKTRVQQQNEKKDCPITTVE